MPFRDKCNREVTIKFQNFAILLKINMQYSSVFESTVVGEHTLVFILDFSSFFCWIEIGKRDVLVFYALREHLPPQFFADISQFWGPPGREKLSL